jgi:hypothetical protein
MAKINIAGAEVEVPDNVAAHLKSTEERLAKIEADSKANSEALAKAKAEADTKAQAEEQARRKAEQDGHLKKGEFDQALEIERKQTRQVAERFRDSELRGMIASNPNLRDDIRESVVSDAVELLRGKADFDFNTGKLVIKDNGVPVTDPKAFVDAWIAARPAWIKPNANQGSGADQTKTGSGAGTGLKRSAMSIEDRADFIAKHGKDAYLKIPA